MMDEISGHIRLNISIHVIDIWWLSLLLTNLPPCVTHLVTGHIASTPNKF